MEDSNSSALLWSCESDLAVSRVKVWLMRLARVYEINVKSRPSRCG